MDDRYVYNLNELAELHKTHESSTAGSPEVLKSDWSECPIYTFQCFRHVEILVRLELQYAAKIDEASLSRTRDSICLNKELFWDRT